jgi:RNA polymerase sigma-70 factor (ECF subfamily)
MPLDIAMAPQMSDESRPATPAPAAEGELDTATLRRAQQGDEAAARVLVRRHERAVFALLGRLLGTRGGLAEDLAQESFLRVFAALGRFDPAGPARLSTWILTIAARVALDQLRRRAPGFEPLTALHDHAGPQRADDQLRRRKLAAAIEAALADLAPEYRVAFVLREFHELEYPEIAAALDIDRGTVKSRLSRARAALRIALAEQDHE